MLNRKSLRTVSFLVTFLIPLFFDAISYSADYGFSWTVFTYGGASRGSENFGLTDSIDPGAVRESSSENYKVEPVFYSLDLEQGPTAKIILDPPAPVSLGTVDLTLITSQEVEGIPSLEFTPQGRSPITVNLTGSDTIFTGKIEIT
ncbi:hypothetical protein KKH56_01160 [bacterium]|nr:hypothetical protein [bacterium]